MINSILIANRGEIAVRIIKTCRKLNIKSIAVYSEHDSHSLFVQMADVAYKLEGQSVAQTYLSIDQILTIAKQSKADAIHPGYGFLSENAEFATRVTDEQLIFIGPRADAILAMGMKSTAKQIMQDSGVNTLPGYNDDDNSQAKLKSEADKIGYPLLIKAAAGGGGKGMRIVNAANQLASSIDAAKRESIKSFANDRLILEKYLTKPRHIEVQILFDNFGNGVYLFERDCSVQRRYQKIIEEAPAPNLSKDLRKELGQAALAAGKAINYTGAGTIEFLLDTDNSFYFMEMNTRLQVEHPITEVITGVDLVEQQIKIANNYKLEFKQEELAIKAHAIEARLYAEDTDNDFLPATGKIDYLSYHQADYLRIDTGIKTGDEVSIYYDPMLAKIIARGENREQAVYNLTQALNNTYLVGVKNNNKFLRACLANEDFKKGHYATDFITSNKVGRADEKDTKDSTVAWLAASLYFSLSSNNKLSAFDIWQNNSLLRLNMARSCDLSFSLYADNDIIAKKVSVEKKPNNSFNIELDQEKYHCQNIKLLDIDNNKAKIYFRIDYNYNIEIIKANQQIYVLHKGAGYIFDKKFNNSTTQSQYGKDSLTAPMPGTVIAINVSPGEIVSEGDTLLVLEAMKMEHAIIAPKGGTVASVNFKQGEQVNAGAQLLVME